MVSLTALSGVLFLLCLVSYAKLIAGVKWGALHVLWFRFQSVLSLKYIWLGALFVLWNAAFGLALWLGGIAFVLNKTAVMVIGASCVTLWVLLFALTQSEGIRRIAVDDNRRDDFSSNEFYLIATTVAGTGAMMIAVHLGIQASGVFS